METNHLLQLCTICQQKDNHGGHNQTELGQYLVKQYKRGDYIAYQGQQINHFIVLSKGKVKTEMASSSGLTLQMDEIMAPNPLATAFLFATNNRFPVDVIAIQDCEVIYVAKQRIEKLIATDHDFMRSFLTFNANRMQYLSERLKIFAQKNIKAKIAYYILIHEKEKSFKLKRTITSLAEYFGVERSSLSRAFSELVKANIITLNHGKGQVLDSNALEELLL